MRGGHGARAGAIGARSERSRLHLHSQQSKRVPSTPEATNNLINNQGEERDTSSLENGDSGMQKDREIGCSRARLGDLHCPQDPPTETQDCEQKFEA